MSSFSQRRKSQLVSEINVVPYIDVMLVLLVIFMVSTPLLTEGVYVDLPQAEGESVATLPEIDRMVISINQPGEIFLSINGSESVATNTTQLSVEIKKQLQKNPSTEFFVKGDKATAYGEVVKLMASLQASGVPNIGLITQASEIEN